MNIRWQKPGAQSVFAGRNQILLVPVSKETSTLMTLATRVLAGVSMIDLGAPSTDAQSQVDDGSVGAVSGSVASFCPEDPAG